MKYRDRRKPTDFEIVLLTEVERKAIDVLDVSPKGLRIRLHDIAVEPEDDVSVEIRQRRYPSRITWMKGGEAGLEFDNPLPRDIFALVSRSRKPGKKASRFLLGP